ncbi:hypothetical protein BJY01DRAFT_217591 [Aspergillus pseudoustus]|uniref:Uncharacterized protein n=1 Tax=Aspergillus pseudoustus TaxID=1810923 RepID=A0ABR4JQN0_9EURO
MRMRARARDCWDKGRVLSLAPLSAGCCTQQQNNASTRGSRPWAASSRPNSIA